MRSGHFTCTKCTSSGRSIPAFDLHAALEACGDLLIKHGGHRAAAGLTIDVNRMPDFAERFNAVARERLTPADLTRTVHLDLELPVAEATADLERLMRHLEPFGVGNPGPTFAARGVRVLLQSHPPVRAVAKALRDVYTHLYAGGAPADLKPKLATPQEMEELLRGGQYAEWMREYLQ